MSSVDPSKPEKEVSPETPPPVEGVEGGPPTAGMPTSTDEPVFE